jgi:hypothetical protein
MLVQKGYIRARELGCISLSYNSRQQIIETLFILVHSTRSANAGDLFGPDSLRYRTLQCPRQDRRCRPVGKQVEFGLHRPD